MNLIVFDIDGTLIRYHPKRNDRAYVRAVKEIFDVEIKDSWDGYKTSTDSGILSEILGRSPEESEIKDFKICMSGFLAEEYSSPPFEAMRGAREFLASLGNFPLWQGALGTGNWTFSAQFKLKSAGFELSHLPMGSADDSHYREQVLAAAKNRALQSTGISQFDRIIYVGDWIWDVQAARALGWDFIGIGMGRDREALEKAGAKIVLEHFEGLERFLG